MSNTPLQPVKDFVGRIFNRAGSAVMNTVNTVVQLTNFTFHVRRANIWRDNYNPLRGLTIRRVVSLLEEGERGAYAELQWTYRFIEKRDATLRGGKRNLLAAVGSMDWEIRTVDEEKLPPGATKQMAEKQKDRLRACYDRIDNLRAAIEHLGLAEFRGFAHLEKIVAAGGEDDGAITHLEPIEQWYLVREGLNGDWQYNQDARFGLNRGVDIDPARVICREIDDPINEIALIAFVRKNLSQKDWDGFVESFGIPSIFAIMPQQVPQGQEDKYLETAEKVISNARGALPAGADIKTVDAAGTRGQNPFAEHLRYQDEQIVLAVTSGLLTMLAQSGSGTLAGGAHQETFERVARALAGRISETFQQQFDKEILATEFPDQPVLAYFAIAAEEETDTGEFIEGVKALSDAGYEVAEGQISEKTGYEVKKKVESGNAETLKGEELEKEDPKKKPQPPIRNRAAAVAKGMGVPEGWLSPVQELMAEMERKFADDSASDADLLAFLQSCQDRLPELLGEMDVSALADALEPAFGQAAFEGLREGMKKTLKSGNAES